MDLQEVESTGGSIMLNSKVHKGKLEETHLTTFNFTGDDFQGRCFLGHLSASPC